MEDKELGSWGEEKAREYLQKIDYRVISANYRNRLGEIDLIARDGDYLVFIEVKTRRTDKYGPPQSAVHYHKQQKIKQVAACFMADEVEEELMIRFDVIAIIIKHRKAFLRHFKNAF